MGLTMDSIKKDLYNHMKKMFSDNRILYETEIDKDVLWNTYLDTIPAEHNKIYKTNREYDCCQCRHFVKSIGGVVAIKDGKVETIWDFVPSEEGWKGVVEALSNYVKSLPITGRYLSTFSKIGQDHSRLMIAPSKEVINFPHLYFELPDTFVHKNRWETIDTVRGNFRDVRNVFKRSLDELSMDAIDTVLDLIKQGSIYRGEEYKTNVKAFRDQKVAYNKLESDRDKELFAWEKSANIPASVAKIRNTAIGTLLIDISEDVDLEEAVRKYESVTAPMNYKRSKPIFTKKMLEEAQQTITELGYLNSLERRYATVDDITVNNIIYSNKDVQQRMNKNGAASLFEQLSDDIKSTPKKFDRVEQISIDKFISDVVPTATEIEAYVESKFAPNFMSLIAPVHKDSKTMFKWNNNFSWAYSGNVTDSIVKQNVKNAGGNVNGVLRFSIQWNDIEDDHNDLDAHCIEPNGDEIFFSTYKKPRISRLGGQLDVDIIDPKTGVPAVENITYSDLRKMRDGEYEFAIHCYTNNGGRSGFRAEIEFEGNIYSYDYTHPLKYKETVKVANVTLKDGHFSIKELLPSNCKSREIWGVKTNEFVPVSVICYSPNYWDEQNGIGNKHYFFMLNGCINPELPNAYYNELLNSELYPKHRKVMEALGSKAHVLESDDQLSGLGFSSTLRNELVVKVKGSSDRVLKIIF